ncbi:hypothetical protein AC249_AIPGENE12175 [Exaiptasia diaphana]|nr:hypothetical protein AC249_AIPGENE12175 [Exaiptasia diaphana]
MDRLRKFFRRLVRRRNERESEPEEKGRSFENPHRSASPWKVIPIHSKFTPGLGRRIPELVEAGAASPFVGLPVLRGTGSPTKGEAAKETNSECVGYTGVDGGVNTADTEGAGIRRCEAFYYTKP